MLNICFVREKPPEHLELLQLLQIMRAMCIVYFFLYLKNNKIRKIMYFSNVLIFWSVWPVTCIGLGWASSNKSRLNWPSPSQPIFQLGMSKKS